MCRPEGRRYFAPIIAPPVHFRPRSPIDCRPLSRNLCIFGQKAHPIVVHFVTHAFVFIHIPGSIFIFNIFMGERPVSDPEKQIRDPPQLAQAGIFHPPHEHRVQQSGVSLLPTALCLLRTVLWFAPTPLYRSAVLHVSQRVLALQFSITRLLILSRSKLAYTLIPIN